MDNIADSFRRVPHPWPGVGESPANSILLTAAGRRVPVRAVHRPGIGVPRVPGRQPHAAPVSGIVAPVKPGLSSLGHSTLPASPRLSAASRTPACLAGGESVMVRAPGWVTEPLATRAAT